MESKEFEKIAFTGERMINHPDSLMYAVSFERYKFASKFAENKNILDIACGSGYGSDFLARNGNKVVGVDIDEEIIAYCKNKYSKENVEFEHIFPETKINEFVNKFDLIVSFETIEHTQNYLEFLNNLKVYLNDKGVLILSTPNNFKKINPPENKFHIYEFDIIEMYEILKKTFIGCRISAFGQCATNTKRLGSRTKSNQNIARNILGYIIKKIYNADKKYFNILYKLEHYEIYKFISKFQRSYDLDVSVYEIDPQENFLNPGVSIFIVER